MFGWFSGKAALTPKSRIQPILSRTTSADIGQQETTPKKPATTTPVPLPQPRPLMPNCEVSQAKGATKSENVGTIGQVEFERIVASFSPDGPVRMSLTIDPMDDAQVITFSLNAISHQGDADVVPSLNIRARRKGSTTVLEDFCFLGERYLFRRGPDPNVQLRWDSHEAVAAKIEPSTNQSALFFRSCEFLCGIMRSDRLLMKVVTRHGVPLLATFMPGAVRPAADLLGAAVLGPAMPAAKEVPVFVLDWLLRCGPQNTEIYKEALRSVGFYKGVPGVSKPADLFRALHSYAVSRRAGEIFGYVDPNNLTKVNEGWSTHLRREMPAALRSRQGPLRIFQ